MATRLSPDGIRFIQGEEGLSLTAYPDPLLPKVNGTWNPKQLWSIGYGHQLPAGQVWEGHRITREQADAYFDTDRISRELGVALLTPSTTQQQFDAMVSLSYNIGLGDLNRVKDGGFATSTVQRKHNAGDFAGAADAFRLWNKSGGSVNPVLVGRRERERSVYLNGYPGQGYSQPVQTPAAPAPAPSASTWEPPPPSSGGVTPRSGVAVAAAAVALGAGFFLPVNGGNRMAWISAHWDTLVMIGSLVLNALGVTGVVPPARTPRGFVSLKSTDES
jgi:lysozyme